MAKKRMLMLKACGMKSEKHECNGICTQAKLYGINVQPFIVEDNLKLEEILYSNGRFDYIYLSSHGNTKGFSSENEKAYS
jgi:hypothetical protein